MLAAIGAMGMSEELGERIAVVETIIPFFRSELEAHRKATESFHAESIRARQETNQKIDALAATIAARENQAIGGLFVGKKLLALVGVVSVAGGSIGGKVGAFLTKLW